LLTVNPKNDLAGELLGFEYTYGGKKTEYKPEELIYFWKKSLTKRNQPGVSAAMVALGPASQLFAIDSFIASYFNRGAVPVTVWPVDPATPKEEQERFQNWLNRSMSGVAQAFRNIVIRTRPDVKAQTIGSNVKDTQAPELVTIARDNVAVAFNIPPSILSGANGDESNQRADYAAFYQFCVTPLIDMLCQTLNEQFLSAIGLELWPETDRLPVMAQAKLDQLRGVAEITPGQQILTRAEARELVGYATEDVEKDVTTLNGAQVTAVLDVLRGMSAGEIAAGAALPVIMALGIDEKTAQAMVDAQEAMKTEAEDSAEDDTEDVAEEAAPMPTAPAPMAPQAPEDDDMGEDMPAAKMAAWRRVALMSVGQGVGSPYDDELTACKTAGEVRAVFERHWPKPRPVVSDVARLAIALEAATKALAESETE